MICNAIECRMLAFECGGVYNPIRVLVLEVLDDAGCLYAVAIQPSP
jgi:hypothetical protein